MGIGLAGGREPARRGTADSGEKPDCAILEDSSLSSPPQGILFGLRFGTAQPRRDEGLLP